MDRITWDPDKERLNQAKHGVGFAEASAVVVHRLTRDWPDLSHSHHEPRTLSMGISATGDILVVVTAVAYDGSIRIISARRATKRERHAYEAG